MSADHQKTVRRAAKALSHLLKTLDKPGYRAGQVSIPGGITITVDHRAHECADPERCDHITASFIQEIQRIERLHSTEVERIDRLVDQDEP